MTGTLCVNGLNGFGYGTGCNLGESVFSDPTVFYNSAATNPIFAGGFNYPVGDAYAYCGMGYMPYGNGLMQSDYAKLSNMSPDERTRYLAELDEQNYAYSERRSELAEDKQYERGIKRVQRQNGIESAERAARDAAIKLCNIINMNRKDEVIECFAELKRQVAHMPQCRKLVKGADGVHVEVPLDDKELSAYARDFYAQVNGVDLVVQINNELADSFTQGLKTGLSLGIFGDKNDADTLTESIMGIRRDSSNRAARTAGRTLGGLGTGAATGAGIGTLICLGPGTAVGAIVGGIVGGVAGLISSLW